MSAYIPLRTRLSMAAAFCVLSTGIAASQQPTLSPAPDASNLTIKRTVHNVILDVVVTGTNRKPLAGLTKDDFVVTEDDAPQRILTFEPHDFGTPNEEIAAKVLPMPPNTFVNVPTVPERGPLNVILYDMLNTYTEDQIAARAALIKFVRSKPSGSRFAVYILYNNLEMIQGFTDDQKQLVAVLDSKRTWPRPEANGTDRDTVNAFLRISQFLAGLPGRKNLIWMSDSFPSSFLSSHADENGSYNEEMKQVASVLMRGQIAVYPVDVHGLVGANPTGHVSALYRAYAVEDEIADATGGHAVYSSNDMTSSLTQVIEEGSTYYTLNYTPTNEKYDGRLRKIRVKISKPGYTLAYRHSYFGDNPDSPSGHPGPSAGDVLDANMQHGAPLMHGVLFSAHIRALGAPVKGSSTQMSYVSEPESKSHSKGQEPKTLKPIPLQPYAVVYNVPATQFQPETSAESGGSASLQFSVASFDADGRMVYRISQQVQADSDAQKKHSEHTGYRVEQEVDVPVKSTSIRIAVRDVATGRIGAMEVPLPLSPESPVKADARPGGSTSAASNVSALVSKAD